MIRACWDKRAQRAAGCGRGESCSCQRGQEARKIGRLPRFGDLAFIDPENLSNGCPHYLSPGVVPVAPPPGDSPYEP